MPISISKFSEGIENFYDFAFRTEHTGIWPSLLAQNIPKGVHKDSFSVAEQFRMQSIRPAVYLDIWLALNAIWRMLLQDRQNIPNLHFLSQKEGKDQKSI